MAAPKEVPTAGASTAGATRCPHCHGPLETLGSGRGGRAIVRCRTCGREPGDPGAALSAASGAAPAVSPTGRPCAVPGCTGVLGPSGGCRCCARRAAWADEHLPKRICAICDGALRGSRNTKYCKPCAALAKRGAMATAPSQQKKAKRSAAST